LYAGDATALIYSRGLVGIDVTDALD
jgi:hypothetical protein